MEVSNINKAWYSPREIAALIGVSPDTVRGYIASGIIKGCKLGKKLWRVSDAALTDFLQGRATVPVEKKEVSRKALNAAWKVRNGRVKQTV